MGIVATRGTSHKNNFCAVAEPFLHAEGLPFAEVLDAASIQRVFREENALFGQNDIFSTDVVLWAFLAQTLRDGKGAACAAAVADITTGMAGVDVRRTVRPNSRNADAPRSAIPRDRPRTPDGNPHRDHHADRPGRVFR